MSNMYRERLIGALSEAAEETIMFEGTSVADRRRIRIWELLYVFVDNKEQFKALYKCFQKCVKKENIGAFVEMLETVLPQ